MKLDYMDAEWHPATEQSAQVYIDRVARKRARDEERTIRRCQKFADDLWNMALGGFLVFMAFALIVSL